MRAAKKFTRPKPLTNSQGNHKRLAWVPVYIISTGLIIAFYIMLLGRGCPHFYEFLQERDPGSVYQKLADSFWQGRVDLLADPDPNLYDPKAPDHIYELRYRTYYISDHMLFDYSYYKNKHSPLPRYYLYFGPGVAILFYLPIKLFFNFYLGQASVLAFIASLHIIIFAGLLRCMVENWFDEVPLYVQSFAILCYGCCNLMPIYMDRPLHGELAIAAGILFSILTLYGLVLALNSKTWTRFLWLWVAGTAMGIAMSCRYDDVFMGVPLIIAWLYFVLASDFKPGTIRNAITTGLALFSSPLLIGLSLLWYNYIRFDDPFETGIRYQLNSEENIHVVLFALSYIPDGIWSYYLLPYQITPVFPYIDYWNYTPSFIEINKVRDSHTGLLFSFPVCLLGFLWPYYVLQLKPMSVRIGAGIFAAIVSSWHLLLMLALTAYFATIMRYETELQMPMLLLSTITVLARRQLFGAWAWWEKTILIMIILYSMWMGFIYGLIGPWRWIEAFMINKP